jgi:hypothetical protein
MDGPRVQCVFLTFRFLSKDVASGSLHNQCGVKIVVVNVSYMCVTRVDGSAQEAWSYEFHRLVLD